MNIDFHTHNKNSEKAIINLIHTDEIIENKYCSVGIHPWHINEDTIQKDIKILKSKAQEKNILSIGECGFDKNSNSDLKTQEKIISEHILLSEKLRKPLVIHCVGHFDKLIKIKKNQNNTQAWIIHGYNKNTEILKDLVNNGFFFSLGVGLLKNKSKASDFLKIIPTEKMFFETDDNSTHSIDMIYSEYAKILNLNNNILQSIVINNIKNLNLPNSFLL